MGYGPVLLERDVRILRAFQEHEGLGEIARSLGISVGYLKNLLVYIREELGVRTNVGAVVTAHRLGLVPIEEDRRP